MRSVIFWRCLVGMILLAGMTTGAMQYLHAGPSTGTGVWNQTVKGQKAKHDRLQRTISKAFHVPAALKAPVDFWRDIYTKYDKDHVVLHDTKHLGIIYQLIDLTDISSKPDLDPTEMIALRRERVGAAKGRVRDLLRHLSEAPQSNWTSEEKQIARLFGERATAADFRAAMADDRLRSQTGQRDKFLEGIKVAGRYMPMIEKIFREQGLPWEITRLPFVESMFQLRALSKAGASGIWQFMAGTARLHGLTHDRYIDERNDPVAATQAAARLLKTDYAALGSWPLAINAYNSGRGRLQQAVGRLGTSDITKIIYQFDHPGYGFASRNFYPEFLAALDAYEHSQQYFAGVEIEPPLAFEAIVTTAPVPLPELARLTNLLPETLQLLNPAYSEEVLNGTVALPPGYTLKVPAHHVAQFVTAIDQIGRSLGNYGFYVVKAGETLPSVATKVGVSPQDIRSLNTIRGSALTPGQILRLPEGILSTTGTAAAQPE